MNRYQAHREDRMTPAEAVAFVLLFLAAITFVVLLLAQGTYPEGM